MWTRKFFSSHTKVLLLWVLQIMLTLPQHKCVANNPQTCAPSSCGKISNIRHPFRLKGDPTTCGDPRYELACENNIAVLPLFAGKYYVQAIHYSNFTIRVVDPAVHEANCSSVPRFFLSASNFTDFYNRSSAYSTTPYQATRDTSQGSSILFQHIIYLNCRNPVKDHRYADTAPCVNWGSKGHAYAIVGDIWPMVLKVGCQVKMAAATSVFGFQPFYYFDDYDLLRQNFSYAEIHRMLGFGFEVSWMTVPCEHLCENTPNCYCFFNETSKRPQSYSRSDYCYSPLGFEVRCGNISKQRIFVEDIVHGIAKGFLQIRGVKIGPSTVGYVDSKLAIEIGRITGRYVLPPCIIIRLILTFIVLFAILIYKWRRRHISMYEIIENFLQGNTLVPIMYSYREIKTMTKGFKYKLGEGGYGSVYKGKLRSGSFVAIKMLGKPKANGQEFISEIATIGRIHHANVVRLIGFCVEGSKRALVYEFMPNGSLDRYISSKEDNISLPCDQMYKISLGVARGIAYLHQGCDMQILHFDIKPHNILLDENFVPKVSDFGLARLYPVDNSIVTLTAARGTIGYMAPELFYQNIGVSFKVDVYSFGMLLMEMASKRRNLNPHADDSSKLFFPFWIYNQLIEEKDIEIGELTNEEKNNIKKMFKIALWCIQLKPSDRPSMKKVIEMLEGDVESIEMPPKPSLYPNEMIQGDLETNSDTTISNNAASLISL
ncbi:LEAF RUST 10 DISEASE-RESISTANCE LOCUS RECEPTOR-LIKE PROTEIN KINASE-like 2.1 [Abrus precatorius]|uniref:LEAF RUST 10 DISEASE-RESISTANCE LOCUS RECEPTOR-LIKE PROTEIN KINASE-like 2.1 n=1 Tax=Abrus precatorius TaxID=3816 RepID=A0A8B8KKC3_ABRPR|nr:LEAF RUST 10 DISEASE-RESISTANCE LOCUS RECEPTOR-LIKE PROTEIN KINASE-like 2.1 [Abrus precatorius]